MDRGQMQSFLQGLPDGGVELRSALKALLMSTTVMPRTFTLVRHGESEGNAAKRLREKSLPVPNEEKLRDQHTSLLRLTPRGVKQAQRAGEWLREDFARMARELGETPFANALGFFSPYVRAMETTGEMDLPIVWMPDARLCERNYGDLDQLTYEERALRYASLDKRERHGMFWPAGTGETLQAVSTRIWQHFYKLCNEHSERDVVEVSHGETILTKRFMLERWLPEEVVRMMYATDTRLSEKMLGVPTDFQNKIVNCRIVQYTRQREDGTWSSSYTRVRTIAPLEPDNPAMNLPWTPIVRRKYSSAQLLEYARQFPHFLNVAA